MKIAQVTPFFHPAIGGAERHVAEISTRLAKSDDVIVVTSDFIPEEPARQVLCREERLDRVLVRRTKGWRLLDLPYGLGVVFPEALTVLKRERPDIVHYHGYGFFPSWATLGLRMLKVPLVFTPHLDAGADSFLKTVFDLTVGRCMLSAPDGLVALTEREKSLLERLGAEKRRISVIPNGVDEKFLSNGRDSGIFRRKFGLESERMILFVGRIAKNKGLKYLLYAFASIVGEQMFQHTHLVLIGPDVGYRTEVEQLVRSLGLVDKVLICGSLPHESLFEAYSDADLFVLPSVTGEAFGLSLLEAMACGVPVAATNVGGIPDLVQNGLNGLLVSKQNVASLTETIRYLLSHKEAATRMSINARQTASQYSWTRVVSSIRSLYERLAG